MTQDLSHRTRKFLASLFSGGCAALLTQPFEVLKTHILCSSPTVAAASLVSSTGASTSSSVTFFVTSVKRLHSSASEIHSIEQRGVLNFFRGGGVGAVRQAIGFTLYTSIIEHLNERFASSSSSTKRLSSSSDIARAGVLAGLSKGIAITITCPLVVLKTRLELITATRNIPALLTAILAERAFFRGLGSLLSRELIFSVCHYSTFRIAKQIFQDNGLFTKNTFVAPYIAGIVAVLLSHPFEVIRSRMMINQANLPLAYQYASLTSAFTIILKTDGVKGFFQGIIPRLMRKPINTAISWGLYELFTAKTKATQV